MPIDRDHAFADGLAYPRPAGWLPPWKRRTPAGRAALAWRQFSAHARVASGCRLGPNAWCVNSPGNPDLISLGEQVVCRGLLRIERFGAGRIVLHPQAYIGDDCLLSAAAEIEIGRHALLAHEVQIFDNDSHPLEPAARSEDYASVLVGGDRGAIAAASVRIGERAWIGFRAIILKGVTVGENSVVAAGSVVTRDVPPNTVVAGNPAAFVKSINHVPA